MKVFLGGTVNSNWREELIPKLKIDYFDPIVDDWNEEAQKNEEYEKENCDYLLFVITPKMKGCFSVAEVVDASNKKPEKTISCVLDEDQNDFWSKSQKGSFKAVMNMVKSNGAKMFTNLQNTLEFLNNK